MIMAYLSCVVSKQRFHSPDTNGNAGFSRSRPMNSRDIWPHTCRRQVGHPCMLLHGSWRLSLSLSPYKIDTARRRSRCAPQSAPRYKASGKCRRISWFVLPVWLTSQEWLGASVHNDPVAMWLPCQLVSFICLFTPLALDFDTFIYDFCPALLKSVLFQVATALRARLMEFISSEDYSKLQRGECRPGY